jgi:carboxypeptidase family protein/uncharacterized protein DUF5666
MEIGVSARRRSALVLFITVGFVALSCSDRESPTSPTSRSASMATISGTLLAASDAAAGRGGAAAGEPLANVTVRAVSTGQTTQTDAAGRFTLTGLAPGSVTLQFSGPGVQASATVAVSAGATAKVTVTVSRGRSTVNVSPRSDGTEGTVSKISAPSFMLMNPGGTFTVMTDSNTQFRMGGAMVGFGALALGQKVEVEGSPQPDGSILAARVQIENPEQEEVTRTPTPTVTGTPPTATATRTPRPDDFDEVTKTRTPTVTGTPPTATPTRTPEVEDNDRTKTPSPTVTGTPPTATPTRTPEVEDNDRTKTPTVTGTPPSPTATRTPEPEDGDLRARPSRS